MDFVERTVTSSSWTSFLVRKLLARSEIICTLLEHHDCLCIFNTFILYWICACIKTSKNFSMVTSNYVCFFHNITHTHLCLCPNEASVRDGFRKKKALLQLTVFLNLTYLTSVSSQVMDTYEQMSCLWFKVVYE